MHIIVHNFGTSKDFIQCQNTTVYVYIYLNLENVFKTGRNSAKQISNIKRLTY